MSTWEIILIGVGLSMDAVAVSLCNAMAYQGSHKNMKYLMPLFFGVFQGLMPLIGFYAGGIFADIMERYANIVVFIILLIIGGKMIYESFKGEDEDCESKSLTVKLLFFQAIATSIDAFAVGIGFSAKQVSILPAVSIIAVTTFVFSFIAVLLGKKFGTLLGKKAELLGGAILCFIGIKTLF